MFRKFLRLTFFFLQLTVKALQFLLLMTKFLAVLLTVYPIENLSLLSESLEQAMAMQKPKIQDATNLT